jgi:D-3-phosphoglycerate dehydrogenase
MTLKVLLTTTSFQDTPGPHHKRLAELGANVHRSRGPLNEQQLMELVGDFDGILCGDDAITRRVLEKSLPRLKVISKYGVGVDKIDVNSCRELGVPLTYCPGVNHTTVAEHVFLLMLASLRKLTEHANAVRNGQWTRQTGFELREKLLGVVGLGRIGQEVIKRASAFEMSVIGFGANFWPVEFAQQHQVQRAATLKELFEACDVLSLNTSLNPDSRQMINAESIGWMKDTVVIVNCGRGELVNSRDVRAALEAGRIGAYATDVLDEEPPPPNHCLLNAPNCLVTPHIASRTHESVARQAMMATENLIRVLNNQPPLAQI